VHAVACMGMSILYCKNWVYVQTCSSLRYNVHQTLWGARLWLYSPGSVLVAPCSHVSRSEPGAPDKGAARDAMSAGAAPRCRQVCHYPICVKRSKYCTELILLFGDLFWNIFENARRTSKERCSPPLQRASGPREGKGGLSDNPGGASPALGGPSDSLGGASSALPSASGTGGTHGLGLASSMACRTGAEPG